jgi:hypothetical protein
VGLRARNARPYGFWGEMGLFFDDGHFTDFVAHFDCIHYGHIIGFAEHGVDTIQVGLRRMADEELTSPGVEATVGHG